MPEGALEGGGETAGGLDDPMRGNVADDATQVFLGIPIQLAQDGAERFGEIGGAGGGGASAAVIDTMFSPSLAGARAALSASSGSTSPRICERPKRSFVVSVRQGAATLCPSRSLP